MLKLKSTFSVVGFIALLTFASASSYGQKAQPAPSTTDVNVVNTPTVVVGNSTNNPVLVRNVEPAREPYQVGGVVTGQCVQNQFVAERLFTIPQGKRFIIEHVSFRSWMGSLAAGEGLWVEIVTTFNGELRGRSLDFNRQTFGSVPFLVANHPMLAYADGGTDAVVRVRLSSPPSCSSFPTAVAHGIITGYLVDVP
jgi:hypothetical protein